MPIKNRAHDRLGSAGLASEYKHGCFPARRPAEQRPVVTMLLAPTPELAAQMVRQNLRIAELERQVYELRARARDALPQDQRAVTSVRAKEYDPRLADVLRMTQELFPGAVTTEVVDDPENPDNSFVVFRVSSPDAIQDIAERRIEWHTRLRRLPPGSSGSFRLSINPV